LNGGGRRFNGNPFGGFPPGVPVRPRYPHPLDILRQRALAARMQQGHPMPYPREDSNIPRQGEGEPWDEGGSDRMPAPGWHQNPDSAEIRGVTPRSAEDATVRWGDTKEVTLPADPLGVQSQKLSTYLIAIDLAMPATGLLRLSVTSPDIAAVTANWTCDWLVQTGVGQSLFEETVHVNIAPANGTARTTFVEQLPVQSLRITATVNVGPLSTEPRVTVNAQWAPFTSYPDLVRLISQQVRHGHRE